MRLLADSTHTDLYLASRSPRRADLLRQLGIPFETVDVCIDETPYIHETAQSYVGRMAQTKVLAGRDCISEDAVILGADTTVTVDGRVLGKPQDASHARDMLRALSGRWHEVWTGVAIHTAKRKIDEFVVPTSVEFITLTDSLIEAYWQSGEGFDKAGAYGIQGLAGAFVTRIEGSYSAVVGLPLHETWVLLDRSGIKHALRPDQPISRGRSTRLRY